MVVSSSLLSDAQYRYKYRPLDRYHVRLLRLHAVDERIECSLKHVPLAEAKFEALSYVWGSEEKPFRAVIRDESGQDCGCIPLTRNLHNALRDLRDSPELKNENLWIDQISINQEGEEEKNDQVKMMGKIYEKAARVIVYIGPALSKELEDRGVELLYQMDRHFAANYDFISERRNLFSALAQRSKFPIGDLCDDTMRKYTANEWKWLADLASGEWYHRLWMVQVLARPRVASIYADLALAT